MSFSRTYLFGPRLRAALPVLAALTLLVVEAAPTPAQESDAAVVQRAGASRAKGQKTAPVLVFEIADFQCPFCARFALDIFPRIDSAYVRTGLVQWVFVNLPLPGHTRAWVAAEAAACAGAVADRFWPMHHKLFEAQQEWGAAADPGASFARYAREVGVPAEPFAACVGQDRVAPMLLEDILFATSTGASGTPAFIVNREELVVGLKTFEEWQAILEKAIQKRRAGGR
jgi:protein-disulfide isomerase